MLAVPCCPTVIPNFLGRVGSLEQRIVDIFKEKVGFLVGLIINTDGSVGAR